MELKMTRKEMIEACVDDQIKRGVIESKNRSFLIRKHLVGFPRMSYSDCKSWYDDVFKK